jgi:hypothetical protein
MIIKNILFIDNVSLNNFNDIDYHLFLKIIQKYISHTHCNYKTRDNSHHI